MEEEEKYGKRWMAEIVFPSVKRIFIEYASIGFKYCKKMVMKCIVLDM